MPTIGESRLLQPKSWEEFESIVLSAFNIKFPNLSFSKHGRQGTKQEGVDIFSNVSPTDSNTIGIQCKNTIFALTLTKIKEEIDKAAFFQPALNELYIATTSPRDPELQRDVLAISKDRAAKGNFIIHLIYWDEITNELSKNMQTLYAHYPYLEPKKDGTKEKDEILYHEFINLLPSNSYFMNFIRSHDFHNHYETLKLSDGWRFIIEWDNSEHEFLDNKVEEEKNAFRAKLFELLDFLRFNTFPENDSFFNSFRKSFNKNDDYTEEEKELIIIANKMATEIWEMHQKFIQLVKLCL